MVRMLCRRSASFDQNNPQVLGHGHEQFAEILGLLGLAAGELQVGQLGDAIDQLGDLFPEQLGHLAVIGLGVLDRVMQQGGDNRRIIQTLFGQDGGDGYGMGKIGLAGMAELPFMHLPAKIIGTGDALGICLGVVVADQRNQVVSRNHPVRTFVFRAYPWP